MYIYIYINEKVSSAHLAIDLILIDMIVNNLIKYINLLIYYDNHRLCIHCSYIIYPFILQSIQIRYGRVQYVKTSSITTSKYLKTLHDIFAIGVVTTTGTSILALTTAAHLL